MFIYVIGHLQCNAFSQFPFWTDRFGVVKTVNELYSIRRMSARFHIVTSPN